MLGTFDSVPFWSAVLRLAPSLLCSIRRVALAFLLLLLGSGLAVPAIAAEPGAQLAEPLLATARAILAAARAEADGDCQAPSDRLTEILCQKALNVGLRASYPGFSQRGPDGAFTGFEVDLARRIADFLGVEMRPVRVTPKSRVPLVVRGQADLSIATTGHDRIRDSQVRFIRPHYFASQTALVGPKSVTIRGWDDLIDQTICMPLGASSNMMVSAARVKVLIFETPRQLADALNFERCRFIVHDDSFFWRYRDNPEWADRFEIKFTFAPIRWGMIVAPDRSDRLADILTLLSVAYHIDGTFLHFAATHRLNQGFLEAERHHWLNPICLGPQGFPAPACLADPIASLPDMQTRFARYIDALETHLGAIRPDGMDLSALKHQAMFARLMDGVAVSIALVVGATTMTMLCAIGFATLLVSPRRWLRWPALVVTQIGQTTPMPLLMFFGYVLAGGLTNYTASVAVGVSILILGVYNGCYASRAIAEVRRTAGRPKGETAEGESAEGGQGWTRSMGNAIAVSWTQITAFVVNATKGTPAADMIGVPEFVSVLSDLSAYSWDRTPLFVTLLVFYSGLVLAVIFLLSLAEKWIVRAWSTRP